MPSLSSYRYDKNKEEDGIWFETPEGLKLLIARLGNSKAAKLTRKLAIENQRALRRDKSGDLLLELAIKVHAKHTLIDWKDLLEDDGVPISYSSRKAEELFTEFPAFLEEVLEYATREDEFREEVTGAAVKNS